MVGVVLLDKNDYYVDHKGDIPTRPWWDKEFITRLAEGRNIVCSPNTLKMIPKSIRDVAASVGTPDDMPAGPWQLNFGISTFANDKMWLLFVVRSPDPVSGITSGKKLRLDNFEKVLEIFEGLEIWLRRTK